MTAWPGEDGWSPLDWPMTDEQGIRTRWEEQLWIFDEKRDEWIEAPRMKVFELGKVGVQVLMRTGCRREWKWGSKFVQRDEIYVGATPEEVAAAACAGMPRPCTVLVIHYVERSYDRAPDYYLVNLHPSHVVRSFVQPEWSRQRSESFADPVVIGEPHVTELVPSDCS